MGNFIAQKDCGEIKGLFVITPKVFSDERGYFMETYNEKDFSQLGINTKFCQDNESSSTYGVLRGLHRQLNYPQAKLVRVTSGKVFDVAVDLRQGSETFGKWFGVILSDENKKQFYIPENFAHGFLVLSKSATFSYKVNDFYHPNDEDTIVYNDKTIGVDWPIPKDMIIIQSDKDKNAKPFK